VRPLFRPTQEVRFAVVLYGGVSLAIYINGIVQELLALVRATAPEKPLHKGPQRAFLREDELKGAEPVYRKLGQMLAWHEPSLSGDVAGDARIRTRFVVDILSGTSAGGINAIFLAKALANEQGLAQLRDIWATEAELELLVNDVRSYAHLGLAPQLPPASLLNSRRLYLRVLEALGEMDKEAPVADKFESKLVEELDCWITTTDISGLPLDLRLYDKRVLEPRYRNVFHFAYAPAAAVGADGDPPRRDFGRDTNPFLAYAARCSSSFPFAFEPMELQDIDKVLELPQFPEYGSGSCSSSGAWDRYFGDYVRRGHEVDPKLPAPRFYAARAFGDGGYLDNKPFSWATATLSRRRADVPVDRRLIYLEPDPSVIPTNDAFPHERPNALDNSLAAAMKVPRAETIREDLERIAERNGNVARLQRFVQIADDAILAEDESGLSPILELPLAEWRAMSASSLFAKRGLQYSVYHRLKVATVLDDLAGLVGRLVDFVEGSDELRGLRCLIEAWLRRQYPESGEGRHSQNEFLLQFDLGYRLRRLTYLQSRIDGLLRGDPRARTLVGLDAPAWAELAPEVLEEPFQEQLRRLKSDLNDVFVRLRARGRRLRAGTEGLVAQAVALGLSRGVLLGFLSGGADERAAVVEAGDWIDARDLMPGLNGLAATIADSLRPTLIDASKKAGTALQSPASTSQDPDIARIQARALAGLKAIDRGYENYDSVILPISYGVVEEADVVEVIRFSPRDAKALIDEETSPRRKLGGAQFGHFGGFLNERWRRNDMMWGRLDAAERLIRTLLPAGHAQAEDLVREAQLAILEDERADVFPDEHGSTAELLEHLHQDFSVDLGLNGPRTMAVAARALTVSDGVIGALPDRGNPSTLVRVVARPAAAALALLAFAARRGLWMAALAAAAAAAGLLLGCGLAFHSHWPARGGWMLAVYTVLTLGLLSFLYSKVSKTLRPKPPAPSRPPPPSTPPGQGFPHPEEKSSPVPGWDVLAALVGAFLVLIFPLAMLNASIAIVVSWLPGWD
jgi:patatin-related protein